MFPKTLAAVVLIPAVILGFGCAGDRLLEHRYDSIARGETEAQVLSVMGEPPKISGAPENVAWDLDATVRRNDVGCVKEFWYRPIFNIVDEEYTVGFDSAGRVVSKYHYISQ